MLGIFYAVITVLAWGTWLAPSQNVPFKNQQIKTFYVAIASLVLAFFVTLPQGFDQITPEVFWPPFIGGLIWAVSGYCAFTATHKIGMARASGIWSPLNIVVSLFWGATIFDEFLNTGTGGLIVLIGSVDGHHHRRAADHLCEGPRRQSHATSVISRSVWQARSGRAFCGARISSPSSSPTPRCGSRHSP